MVAECMQVSSLQAMNRQDFECGSTRLQLCNCASLIGRYACTIADEAITGEPLSDFGRLQGRQSIDTNVQKPKTEN